MIVEITRQNAEYIGYVGKTTEFNNHKMNKIHDISIQAVCTLQDYTGNDD
jgi:hypothetical protein